MKKAFKAVCSVILAIILFAVTAFSVLSIQIFASDNSQIISLEVMWNDMSFVYNSGTSKWNPGSHDYTSNGTDFSWTDDSGKITVVNYSDVSLEVKISFEQAQEPNGTATLKIENPSFTLDGSPYSSNFSAVTAQGIPERAGNIGKIIVAISEFNSHYVRENDVIYFGEYPQTVKNRYVTVSDTPDSRGYYLGSDNEYYARVVATPYESGYTFSSDASITSGQEYYFKVEPIKWRIISENNGTAVLLCESIIASSRYDDLSNNYAESEIREWLNESFYNSAFSELERSLIQAVMIDGGVSDNVYLASYADVSPLERSLRAKNATDYARASGAWVSTSYLDTHNGNGIWTLRTPNDTYAHFVNECNHNGDISDGGTNISSKFLGVVPALTIKL